MIDIIGVDEVNYSPSICGDTIVCACLLLAKAPRGLLKDSKVTTHKHRLKAFKWLQLNSVYSVEVAAVNHIQFIGIYSARNLAMFRAAMGLISILRRQGRDYAREVVIDGNAVKELQEWWVSDGCELKFKVGADATVPAVSAASIIARIYADALFEGWEVNWPGYGMNRDHGSLSVVHKEKLAKDGASPIHRTENYGKNWWGNLLEGEKKKGGRK